jgi:hypothetical protein
LLLLLKFSDLVLFKIVHIAFDLDEFLASWSMRRCHHHHILQSALNLCVFFHNQCIHRMLYFLNHFLNTLEEIPLQLVGIYIYHIDSDKKRYFLHHLVIKFPIFIQSQRILPSIMGLIDPVVNSFAFSQYVPVLVVYL